MKGGLTYKDLDALKAKAQALDEALAWLEGRCDSEKLMQVERILRKGLQTNTEAINATRR